MSKPLWMVVRSGGAAWREGVDVREQPLWDEHAAFMDALFARGAIVAGGPLDRVTGATLLIFEADSADELREMLAADPWVTGEIIRTGDIRPWTVWLGDVPRNSGPIPINSHLGMNIVRSAEGSASIEMTPQAWFKQEGGVIHGGILTSLADTAAVYCIHPVLAGRRMTSIELKVNFLAAGRLDGGPLVAEARTIRQGARVAVVASDVRQDGNHILTGLFTYLITAAG